MRYHDADCLATAVSGAGARSEQPSATPRVGPLIGGLSIWVPSQPPTFGEFLGSRFFRRAALTDVERTSKGVVSASNLAKSYFGRPSPSVCDASLWRVSYAVGRTTRFQARGTTSRVSAAAFADRLTTGATSRTRRQTCLRCIFAIGKSLPALRAYK
jgi:hypothetical protein